MSKSTPSLLKAIADYKAEHGGEPGREGMVQQLGALHASLGGPDGPSVPDVRQVAVERLKQHATTDIPAHPDTTDQGASDLPEHSAQPQAKLEGKPAGKPEETGSFNDRRGSEALLKRAKEFLRSTPK